MLQTAAQKQVVGTIRRCADAHALAVNVWKVAKRGAGRHKVGAFDFYIRGGEVEFTYTSGIDREECDIPSIDSHPLDHLSCRLVADQLDRHTDPPTQFPGQIDCHATEISIGRISCREDRVSIVDSNAQLARRSKIEK